MELLGTEKNHATSRVKKKSLNLLGPTKSRNLLGQKKLRNLLVQKKITQTSWDKNGPKNSNLSHNQNPGDRHRSPWSCLSDKLSKLVFILFQIYSILEMKAIVCHEYCGHVSEGPFWTHMFSDILYSHKLLRPHGDFPHVVP